MVKPRYLLLLLVLVGSMMAAHHWSLRPQPEQADYYPRGRDINAFSLIDGDGNPFTPASLAGHWTFLFLGYTHCPDVCPTTLANLSAVYPELTGIAPSSQVLFVSADPERDDSARLKRYAAFFQPAFKVATGPHNQLFPFVRNLGLVYSIAKRGEEDKDYQVDHSPSIALINPAGKLVAVFRPQLKQGEVPHVVMETLVSDFARIVQLAEE